MNRTMTNPSPLVTFNVATGPVPLARIGRAAYENNHCHEYGAIPPVTVEFNRAVCPASIVIETGWICIERFETGVACAKGAPARNITNAGITANRRTLETDFSCMILKVTD